MLKYFDNAFKKLLLVAVAVTATNCYADQIDVWLNACNNNNGDACFDVAYAQLHGLIKKPESYPQLPKNPIELLQKGCDLESGFACLGLALQYMEGINVEKDISKAIKLLDVQCDKGFGLGCLELHDMYYSGEQVPRSMEKANDYLVRSCDAKSAIGCWNLGRAYSRGVNLERNYFKAAHAYEVGCDGLNLAYNIEGIQKCCLALGNSYETGKGVLQSYANAKKYYAKVCVMENQEGCDLYAKLNKSSCN